MVFLKDDRAGYVCIDHRESPGFTPQQCVDGGRTKLAGHIGAGQMFEAKTDFCSHCERVVIRNPDRLRQRGWCWNCDHFICDDCALVMKISGECMPMAKKIEKLARSLT